MIRDHWRQVWDRDRPADQDILDAWRSEAGPARQPLRWEHLSAEELSRTVASSTATAAGPSGWTVAELQDAPLDFWRDFAQVLQHWFDSGCSPLAWREILMCSIPKGKEPRADGAVDVNGLRRISVECALWSLVASTFCRCDSVRHWALSWAPREFYGALQGRDCFSGLFFFKLRCEC